MAAQRNTAIRDRHRKAIARGKPPCGICHQPIDYTLPHHHPGSFVVDHVMPLHHGGADSLANKQAAHRRCNRLKSDTIPQPIARPMSFATSRAW